MAGNGVQPGRYTAEMDGDFVVFLIGMRLNKLWKIHKWIHAFFAMPRMLRELQQQIVPHGVVYFGSVNHLVRDQRVGL